MSIQLVIWCNHVILCYPLHLSQLIYYTSWFLNILLCPYEYRGAKSLIHAHLSLPKICLRDTVSTYHLWPSNLLINLVVICLLLPTGKRDSKGRYGASHVAQVVKTLTADAGDVKLGFDPGSGRSPEGRHGNSLQWWDTRIGHNWRNLAHTFTRVGI